MDNINIRFNRLESLNKKYQKFSEQIKKDALSNLDSLVSTFLSDVENARNENRLLRIGIVGQVKRGKSSLLNSLLFDSQDILPKAATPMTAALTKISYAEEPTATVEFYTEDEWQTVKHKAEQAQAKMDDYQHQRQEFERKKAMKEKGLRPPIKPSLSNEEEAAIELLEMALQSDVDINACLGQAKQISGVKQASDLVSKLNEYVGSSGKYTAFVKSTELRLNIDSLKDIEVVDTPGMNDPIVSRSRRTQDFIGQCDVVLFVSYCGQFLDVVDMRLLAQSIPNKGIENIILIGSIFDSVLLDECHEYQDAPTAIRSITQKLNEAAVGAINQVCEQDGENGNQSHLMKTLQNSLPATFVSARWLDISKKLKAGEELSEEEVHTLKQINSAFEGFEFTDEILEALANISRVETQVNEVRDKKAEILSSRLEGLIEGSMTGARSLLIQMKQDVEQKKKRLEEGDIESLSQKQAEHIKKLESGEVRVKATFEKYRISAEKKLRSLLAEIQQDAQGVKRVESQTGSRQESYETSHEVSDSTWYKPWSWGSTRTEYTTHYRTVNYNYANVNEAVDKLESFVIDSSKALFEASLNAVNLELFRKDIKECVRGLLDFSDDSFDPENILLPLSNAIERITIPAVQLDMDHHIQTVREQFTSAQVEDDKINQLRNEQSRVVGVLLKDIARELETSIGLILQKMVKEEEQFIPSLTKDLKATVAQLEEDLKDKETRLNSYIDILNALTNDLANI